MSVAGLTFSKVVFRSMKRVTELSWITMSYSQEFLSISSHGSDGFCCNFY